MDYTLSLAVLKANLIKDIYPKIMMICQVLTKLEQNIQWGQGWDCHVTILSICHTQYSSKKDYKKYCVACDHNCKEATLVEVTITAKGDNVDIWRRAAYYHVGCFKRCIKNCSKYTFTRDFDPWY